MIRTYTQQALGTITAPPATQRLLGDRRPDSLSRLWFSDGRFVRHLRAVLRISRRRHAIALGMMIATGSAIGTAATAGLALSHHMLHSAVLPLAPAPAPPAPPAIQTKSHRFVADLNKINPLRGLASWYGDVWNGRKTASGETFDETKLTAAHKTLPLGTIVRVTNLNSMRSVIVKINDRGTLAPHRIIDLSSAAAHELGMIDDGLVRVKLEILGKV